MFPVEPGRFFWLLLVVPTRGFCPFAPAPLAPFAGVSRPRFVQPHSTAKWGMCFVVHPPDRFFPNLRPSSPECPRTEYEKQTFRGGRRPIPLLRSPPSYFRVVSSPPPPASPVFGPPANGPLKKKCPFFGPSGLQGACRPHPPFSVHPPHVFFPPAQEFPSGFWWFALHPDNDSNCVCFCSHLKSW